MMTKLNIVLGDITNCNDIEGIDTIVNVTDREVSGRGGKVDKAIHKVAGVALNEECKKFSGCRAGEIKITDAFSLNCKRIFHIVNPKLEDKKTLENNLIKKTYNDCLLLAMKEGVKTIAFPSIRTKEYKISSEAVAEVAIRTIKGFIKENPYVFDEIRLILFDDKTKSEYDVIDAKGDKIFRYMEISVDLQISDYENFVGSIMNLIKGKKQTKESKENIDEKKIKKNKLADNSVDGALKLLEWFLNDSFAEGLVCQGLEKNVFSKLLDMKSIKVKKIDYEKNEKGKLSVNIGIAEYDYTETFAFLSKSINESIVKKLKKKAKNNNEKNLITEAVIISDGDEIRIDDPMLKIVSPALGVVEEVIPDDLKDELITKVLNEASEGICELIGDMLKNKFGIDIQLINLHCKIGY